MVCIIIESNSQTTFFLFCSVHQHGDDYVRLKPPIKLSYVFRCHWNVLIIYKLKWLKTNELGEN